MILTLEPIRGASPRGRGDVAVKTPQLFLAVPSTPDSESAFNWPDWLSPAPEGHGTSAMRLIPLTTSRRSRSK